MKKTITYIIAVALALSLLGCTAKPKQPSMFIEKAQLTKQEQRIAELLGADSGQRLYDFKVDEHVKSLQVNTYKLVDGAWALVSGGGGQVFTEKNGRLALGFDNLAQGLRVALQSENTGSGSTAYSTEPEEDFSRMGRATSILDNRTEITYEQEIPLIVQISTAQNAIRSFQVETYFTPDEYVKQGYEHVYAVTIRFSQKTVDELDSADTAQPYGRQ